jgi:type I restriction enzyme S subunit
MNKGAGAKAGWQTKKLGEVCEIIMGQSPDGDSYNVTGEGVPLINGPVEFSQGAFGKTIRSKFTTQPTKLCKENDLILCVRGSTTGRMNIAGFDACVGRGVAAIRAKEYQLWINHCISSKRDEIHRLGTGATFPNVSGTILNEINLPFPPLAEQQRIVGILDEAFDGIAAAKANAEKNLQNARALFESHLQAVFTQRGDGWVEKTLGDVCHKITDGTHATPNYTKSGVPFLSVKDLTKGFIDFSDTRFISVEEHQALTKRCKPAKNDILYTKVGTTGVAQVVDVDEEFSIFVSVALLKIKHEIIYNWYLEHFLNAPYAREQARQRTRGMANKNLVIADIKEIVVHFPRSLDQQRSLVTSLDVLHAQTQRLESTYRQKLAALDALKKSLLDQAFTGVL